MHVAPLLPAVKAQCKLVGVEEGGDELALGGLGGVLLGELEGHLVEAALPGGVGLTGDAGYPLHQVGRTVAGGLGLGEETVRVVLPVF